MDMAVSALGLLGAVLVSSVLAQAFPKAPVSLIQIALGVLLAVTPIPVEFDLDPDFFMLLFVAPLLYWDAYVIDKAALWRQRGPVLAYALGLVLLVVVVLGFFVHWLIPAIPLAAAFALAAALGPTDAVAVSTLGKRAQIPEKQRTLLEAESLLNDASGVVSFQLAVAALATGTFSLFSAPGSLAWSFVGGIAAGALMALCKGLVARMLRKGGLEDVTFHVLLQVLTPFVIYLLANGMGVSGVIAVVAAGVVDSLGGKVFLPSSARLNIVSSSVWNVMSFALNGVVFVLLGMLLPSSTARTLASSTPNSTLVGYVLLITLVLVALRFVWCLAGTLLEKGPDGRRGHLTRDAAMQALLLTFAGPKGAITLVMCLTIPRFIGAGEVLQSRELIIFLGAGVILATLVLANVAVPLLAPKKAPAHTRTGETEGCIQVLRNVVFELAHNDALTDKRAVRRVIAGYEARIERLKRQTAYQSDAEDALRELAIGWETASTNQQIRTGGVSPIVGYGYLIELERRLSRLHHRGELLWFLRNVKGWFGMMRAAGFKEWGVTPSVRAVRREARERLRAANASYVLEHLRALTPDDGYPVEAIQQVILEYRRVHASGASRMSQLRRDLAYDQSAHTDAVKRHALQVERDEIRRALEEGSISRETARAMRDNVAAIEYDLGNV